MFAWLYRNIANVRNALYDSGVFKSFSLGAPTISIGNITAGGTGKTPLVAFVAEVLAEKGEKVCILTRGYGREKPRERVLVSDGENILTDVRTAGDEPFELAQKLLGKAVVIADANRVAAAKWALERFRVTAFVLDDAFQHRRAKRDLDIVTIDATNPFGDDKNFIREPLDNLKRADAIVITRSNLVDDVDDLKVRIAEFNPDCPIFLAENKIAELPELKDFHAMSVPPASAGGLDSASTGDFHAKAQSSTVHAQLSTLNSLAFCALGNPDSFFAQLKQQNFETVSTQKFPDHHFYTQTDADSLAAKAKQTGAQNLITTAKDAVKLKDLKFDPPCYVAVSKMLFDEEKKLRELIDAVFNRKSQI